MKKRTTIIGAILFSITVMTRCEHSTTASDAKSERKCTQWDSKNAVEERIESLGHTQVSINLNDQADCRYQWLVQFISRNGASEWCAITTDGSSGVVEIVDVTCN